MIQYKNKKNHGGRTGQCEERSTEDDHDKCRSGQGVRVDDYGHHARCEEGISGREERSAYAVTNQRRVASAICNKEQEPQVWVSGIDKEQGLKSVEEYKKMKRRKHLLNRMKQLLRREDRGAMGVR